MIESEMAVEQEFVKDKIRQQLIAVVKKNHWHHFKNSNYLYEILDYLGYGKHLPYIQDIEHWYRNITQLEYIKELCHEKDIEEIIIHSPKWSQIFTSERREHYGVYLSQDDFQLALEIQCLRHRQPWNESNPFSSFQLELFEKKWRATFIHHSLTPDKCSKLFLRNQKNKIFDLEQFNVTQGQKELLQSIITKKKNILITGATGSGKTSFLQSLLKLTGKREHITILEDTHELTLGREFTTNLISSPIKGKSLNDYCHYIMRMRPDRVILGEIRSKEVVPFLLSLNTGHKGMMASLHANSAIDAISRLSLLFQIYSDQEGISYQDIVKLICQGVDYIIHIDQKKIHEIIEIFGCEGTTPYYKTWD